MPGGDGTGPAGMGPMTGRGMGYCVVQAAAGAPSLVPGAGFLPGRVYGGFAHQAAMNPYSAPYGYGAWYAPVWGWRGRGRGRGGFGRGRGRRGRW